MAERYSHSMSLRRTPVTQGGGRGRKISARRILASPRRMVMATFVAMISAMLIFVAVGVTWSGSGGESSVEGLEATLSNVKTDTGPGGDAWGFSGTESYAAIKDNGLYGATVQIYSGWFRLDEGGSGQQQIYFKGKRSVENALFYATAGDKLTLKATLRGDRSARTLNTKKLKLVKGNWYHFTTVVQSGEGMSIWVDGERVARRSLPSKNILNTSDDLVVGNNAGLKAQLTGAIDELTFVASYEDPADIYKAAKEKADAPAESEDDDGSDPPKDPKK